MESAYRQLGEELSDEARAVMTAWVESERAGPRHVHVHRPEAFGLEPDAIRERLGAYCARFDL